MLPTIDAYTPREIAHKIETLLMLTEFVVTVSGLP